MEKEYHITTFRLPSELYDRLRAQAALEGKSVTRVVEESCDRALELKKSTGENDRRLEAFYASVRAAGAVQ
jgi:predicted DNA-binding protein